MELEIIHMKKLTKAYSHAYRRRVTSNSKKDLEENPREKYSVHTYFLMRVKQTQRSNKQTEGISGNS